MRLPMPPGLYVVSSESISPPLRLSKVPRGVPSTVTVTSYWSTRDTVPPLSGGERLGRCHLDDLDHDPLAERTHPHHQDGVQLARGDALGRVHGRADVDVEGVVGCLAVERPGLVHRDEHGAEVA